LEDVDVGDEVRIRGLRGLEVEVEVGREIASDILIWMDLVLVVFVG
jgi:hypothetical protein